MTKASVTLTVAGLATLLWASAGQAVVPPPPAGGCGTDIAAARALIDPVCSCGSGFGFSRAHYTQCAGIQLIGALRAGTVRHQCRSAVRAYYLRSTCGRNPHQNWVPCVRTGAGGRVTCAITVAARCTGTAMVACPGYTHCLDAADTNDDGTIGAGDSGSCVVAPCASHPDGMTCDAGADGTPTKIFIGSTCVACTADSIAAPRFVDNCDGTITDRQTCLVWEKKDDNNAGGLHDQDDRYQWSSTGVAADGGAFTVFIAGLNSAGFAGHHDWRLPLEDGSGLNELESILAALYPNCTSSPCVDRAFNTNCMPGCSATGAAPCSCTQSNFYWSATTNAGSPYYAWVVDFGTGAVYNNAYKALSLYVNVRAVRGGL